MKTIVFAQNLSGHVICTFNSPAKLCRQTSIKLPVRLRSHLYKHLFFSKKVLFLVPHKIPLGRELLLWQPCRSKLSQSSNLFPLEFRTRGGKSHFLKKIDPQNFLLTRKMQFWQIGRKNRCSLKNWKFWAQSPKIIFRLTLYSNKNVQKFPLDTYNTVFTSMSTFRQKSKLFSLKVRKQLWKSNYFPKQFTISKKIPVDMYEEFLTTLHKIFSKIARNIR